MKNGIESIGVVLTVKYRIKNDGVVLAIKKEMKTF